MLYFRLCASSVRCEPAEPETKETTMADLTMLDLPTELIPDAFGTAVQDNADVPVFHGNGPDNYFCATCANMLAEGMPPAPMRKVRVRCGKCGATNCVEMPPPV